METNITLINNLYCQCMRILIQIDNNYHLDLRNSKFSDLIGFSEKIVNKTEPGDALTNITNSIDMIHINTDATTNSILNGCVKTQIH